MRMIVAAMAVCTCIALPAHADWIAFAGSQGGYGFGTHPSSKSAAMNAALEACKDNGSIECEGQSPFALAVKDDWYLVVVHCRRMFIVGASPDSKEDAFKDAIRRSEYDRPESCEIVDSR
jgi:hypothetical protein